MALRTCTSSSGAWLMSNDRYCTEFPVNGTKDTPGIALYSRMFDVSTRSVALTSPERSASWVVSSLFKKLISRFLIFGCLPQ